MKKLLFILCSWLLFQSNVNADEIIISDVTVPQGGTVELPIGYSFTSQSDKVGFTFSLVLPEGLSLLKDNEGDLVYEKDATSIAKLNIVAAGDGNIAGQPSNETATIKGTSGTLLTLTLCASAELNVGSVINVTVTNCTFQKKEGEVVSDINLDDFTFNVTIGEPSDGRTLLDENSTEMPEASGGEVNVRVLRTISAGNWSTIVLPFAMTTAQMKEAFGNDVQLANFTGYEAEEDDGGDIVGITVKFASANAIEANHPYIIKVSKAITEFTVDNVDVDPEGEPTVATVKRTRKAWSELIGTYVANTEVPSKTLFLNSNKFYYSTGSTKMKGYRAYFDFYDVLTDVDDNYEVKMYINEIETKVEGLNVLDAAGNVYDLSGRKVSKAQRGVYIVNGKKVLVK